MSNKAKKGGLVPNLRFPEFREAEEWQSAQLEDLISTVTPPKKIPTSDYLLEGSIPIIDQGQSDIAGWTNDPASLIEVNQPLIVFGDHTCALKLIKQSFAQGADGIKIIKGSGLADTAFLYQFLCFRPVVTEEYKRHFSILKTKVVTYPDRKSGEQQKIANCLASLDELTTLEAQKLDTLKSHKKGLMQQLFPAEGETLPKLRFPEFRDAGEWEEDTLGGAATFINGRAYKQEELLDEGRYRVLRVGNFFSSNHWYYSDLELDADKYCNDGDLLYAWSASFGPRIWKGGKTIYHYHIWKVVEKSGIDKDFLFILLDYETERMKAQSANGLGMLHITKATIEGWQCRFPKIEEQQKIADCLSCLDNLITTQSKKIAALKLHKNGLMQQLFPTLDEVQG